MSITVQFIKQRNPMINEDIVTPRMVNTQTVDFNDWCKRMANGSTVTAADVAAVMKQIENKLPEILSLNAKVICSPEGLTFRPKVTGSLTQSGLKSRLQAKKAAETDPEKAAAIDVDRALTTSDLTISDCTVSIVVDLPKSWSTTFMQKAKLKRVTKTLTDTAESTDDAGEGGSETTGGDETQGGQQTGGSTEGGGSGSGSGSGSGANGSGSDDNGGGGDGGDGLTND